MHKLSVLIILAILVLTGVFVYVRSSQQNSFSKKNKLSIVTSFYPLYFFTSQIVKDKATIINITPAGAEPHDYEPSTQDVAHIEDSQLLVLNGVGFEPWSDNILELIKNKPTKVIFTAETLAQKYIEEDGAQIRDPHVWLDPLLAKQQAQIIADAIISIDPENTAFYQETVNDLKEKLNALDLTYKTNLSQCKQHQIITSHSAFGYLSSSYSFLQTSVAGISPEVEPSPQTLARIATIAKSAGIKYIFFETLLTPRVAETLAHEVGAQTLVFNPLEGLTEAEQRKGSDYFSIQQENINNLKIALECT